MFNEPVHLHESFSSRLRNSVSRRESRMRMNVVCFLLHWYIVYYVCFCQISAQESRRLWWACCMPSDSSRSYTQHVDVSLQVSWHGEVPSWFLFRNPHWTLFDLCVLPRTYHWKSVVWLAQFKENRSVTMQLFLFSACELMNWTWQIYTNYIKLYQQNAFSTLIAGQIRAAHSFSPDLHPMLCRSWFANHPWPWRAWVFGPCKRRPCGATGKCGQRWKSVSKLEIAIEMTFPGAHRCGETTHSPFWALPLGHLAWNDSCRSYNVRSQHQLQ